MKHDDRYVRDILSAKISDKAKFHRMTRLAQRLERDLNVLLTDKNYVGGVQYWIAKYDDMAVDMVRVCMLAIRYRTCAGALHAALKNPKKRQQAVALFRELTTPKHEPKSSHPHPGPKRRRASDQEPARTSPRRSKAV